MAAGRDAERPALALFAAELRAARGHAGLSREDLAVKLNYSPSLVAMIETERRERLSRDFAARCDEVFDTPGTFTRLEERLHDLPYPASFRPFAGYEAEARSLRMFEHVLVPGLLQTPEYARAVLATRPRTTADELEALVAARLSRQVILDRKDPPLLWVLLDEGVLHRPVGTPAVMHAQLLRLAELCDAPYVSLQVIPFSAGRAYRPARRVRDRGDGRFARYRVPGDGGGRPDGGGRRDGFAGRATLRLAAIRGAASRRLQGPDHEGGRG